MNKTNHIRLEYDFVKNEYLKYGYILDEEKYINAFTKMLYHDLNGYKYFQNYNKLQMSKTKKFNMLGQGNPFTLENIKNYININKLDLVLLSVDWIISGSKFSSLILSSLYPFCIQYSFFILSCSCIFKKLS